MLMRGLGPGPALVTTGLGPVIGKLIRILRGGRSVVRDIYGHKIEEFKIAIKLIEINGKELLSPIFNKRNYIVDETIQTHVKITQVNFKSKESKKSTSVFAKIIDVKRGI
jgi:hypothetical protein